MNDNDETIACAGAYDARWREEVVLLGLLCPAPSFRWGVVGSELGIDVPDLSFDDTNLIARALCVGSAHGRNVCCKLAKNLLADAQLWDPEDVSPFVSKMVWGPGPLASLFVQSADIFNERELIEQAIGRVRRLPAIR